MEPGKSQSPVKDRGFARKSKRADAARGKNRRGAESPATAGATRGAAKGAFRPRGTCAQPARNLRATCAFARDAPEIEGVER